MKIATFVEKPPIIDATHKMKWMVVARIGSVL